MTARRGTREIELTRTEYQLLELLLANAKRVLSDNPTRRLDYVDVRSPDRIVFSPQ